jgi:uncharacterized SAM-dependent methyltransferase
LALPAQVAGLPKLGFFPGSTIGNMIPLASTDLLRAMRASLGEGAMLLIGMDRVKDEEVLVRAYDDAQGVTAAFNLNMLTHLNRTLDGTFDVARFRHRAFFNDEASRIEMHLESLEDQIVRVGGVPIELDRGETIWTECSYKYDRPRLERLVAGGGFAIERLWTDALERFWVAFLVAV